MKSIIYGILFVIATSSLGPMSLVDGQGLSQLIQQWYECQNLTMYKKFDLYEGFYYAINTSIPNNTLDDSFYQRQNLTNKTFDQAMEMIRRMHVDTNNCTTRFCDCVRSGRRGQVLVKYGIFFSNASNFAGVKSIVSAFYNRYKTLMKPFDLAIWSINNGLVYPSIGKFVINNDYTSDKTSHYYNMSNICKTSLLDASVRQN